MGTAAAGGSPGSRAMAMASEMDPEETEYLAHLACPTIADDSLAHQGGSDVGQGGRNCCDGLRRTPGMVVPGICPSFPGRAMLLITGSTRIRNSMGWPIRPTASGYRALPEPVPGASALLLPLYSFLTRAQQILFRSNKSQTLTLVCVCVCVHYYSQKKNGRTCTSRARCVCQNLPPSSNQHTSHQFASAVVCGH